MNISYAFMIPSLVILGALLTYPIISAIIILKTKNRLKIRYAILKKLLLIAAISTVCAYFHVSTTSDILDWLLLSSTYLTFCLLLWMTTGIRKGILRIPAIVIVGLYFGLSYLLGTIGALGVGMASGELGTSYEVWLSDGIIYKETTLGNALSDYRGKRVEIYRTIPWLPFIEWRVQKKEYYNLAVYMKHMNPLYDSEKKKIYVSASYKYFKGTEDHFCDTLLLR
jgi:hypothetical protein